MRFQSLDYKTLADCGIAALPTIEQLMEKETNPVVLNELKEVKRIINKNYYEQYSIYEWVVQDNMK